MTSPWTALGTVLFAFFHILCLECSPCEHLVNGLLRQGLEAIAPQTYNLPWEWGPRPAHPQHAAHICIKAHSICCTVCRAQHPIPGNREVFEGIEIGRQMDMAASISPRLGPDSAQEMGMGMAIPSWVGRLDAKVT